MIFLRTQIDFSFSSIYVPSNPCLLEFMLVLFKLLLASSQLCIHHLGHVLSVFVFLKGLCAWQMTQAAEQIRSRPFVHADQIRCSGDPFGGDLVGGGCGKRRGGKKGCW
jgi:hypothetical protein